MSIQFSSRDRVISVILAAAVAGAVFYGAGYRLFWLRWQSLRGRITEAERLLEHKRELFKRYTLKDLDHRPILEGYRQYDSDERVRSRMLAYLQNLSLKSSVRIVDMKPVPARREQIAREFPVNMTLEGRFVDMMRFFYDIETEEAGFQIQEFRFSRGHTGSMDLRCQAVVARIFLSQE